MTRIEQLAADLESVYREIDAELKTYSDKANAGDRTAKSHYDRAEALRVKAHEITRAMASGDESEGGEDDVMKENEALLVDGDDSIVFCEDHNVKKPGCFTSVPEAARFRPCARAHVTPVARWSGTRGTYAERRGGISWPENSGSYSPRQPTRFKDGNPSSQRSDRRPYPGSQWSGRFGMP